MLANYNDGLVSYRELLRNILSNRRLVWTVKDGLVLICPFCEMPIRKGQIYDMHEGLISRGQVKGSDRADLIYHPCNIIFRHHDFHSCMHTGGIGGDKAFEISARYLVEWEGADVRNWLISLQPEFETVAKEALRRFDNVIFPNQF